jgi:hypothetical protein
VSALAGRLPRVAAVRMPVGVEVGALAAVLAAAAYVYSRNLHTYPNFDEGNYLGSTDALRHGQALGRDVFLDQPPGWYITLVAVSYPFGNTVTGIRTGLLVVALLAVVAAHVCGRLAGGPVAGLIAAGVMSVARPLPGFAGLVESEPAAAALAVIAVALAVHAYRRRFRPWAAFAAGIALGASTSVKLPGATAGLPIVGLALLCGSGPLLRRLLAPAAGVVTVVAAIAIAYRDALPQIWHGVFVTHARILGNDTAVSNLHRAATFVDPRTPFGWLVITGALVSLGLALRGHDRRLLAAVWLWAVGGYGFILAMHPLSDHHFVFLAVALALAAGTGLGLLITRLPGTAGSALIPFVVLLVAAGMIKDRREIVDGRIAQPPEITWAVSELRSHTAQGDLVVSDLPIVPYLAHRQMPGQLIDTSIARIALEDLSPREVLQLIDRSRPSAVIVGRMFQTKPPIVSGIRQRFARRLHRPIAIGGYVDVFLDRRS